MSRRKKLLRQEEKEAIIFNDTDESDLEEEDDGWGDYIMHKYHDSFYVSEIDDLQNEHEEN